MSKWLRLYPNRVREVRKKLGLSIYRFTKILGVSRSTIYNTEEGICLPSVHLALRMAKELGTTVENLFPLEKDDNHDS